MPHFPGQYIYINEFFLVWKNLSFRFQDRSSSNKNIVLKGDIPRIKFLRNSKAAFARWCIIFNRTFSIIFKRFTRQLWKLKSLKKHKIRFPNGFPFSCLAASFHFPSSSFLLVRFNFTINVINGKSSGNLWVKTPDVRPFLSTRLSARNRPLLNFLFRFHPARMQTRNNRKLVPKIGR